MLGKTGPADTDSVTNCETTITDCDTETEYYGLLEAGSTGLTSVPLSALASCYKCNLSKLPVLFTKVD